LGERVGREVPAVELAVLAVGQDALAGGVHHGGVDAPFLAGGGGAGGGIGVGRRAGGGQDLLHGLDRRAGASGVELRGVGVEDGDQVIAVAGVGEVGRLGVVVVLREQQVAGRAGVGGDHRRGHDGGGVVPAEGAGGVLDGQGRVEVQHEAARAIPVLGKDAEENIPIRPDERGGRAVVQLPRRVGARARV